MNIGMNSMRKFAVATMVAASSLGAHAQQAAKTMTRNDSIVHTVQTAGRKANNMAVASFSDARKAMGAQKAAPKGMVKVTREQGSFVGKLHRDGQLEGDLAYNTTSKMIANPENENKLKLTYGATYLSAQNLPKTTGGFTASASKGRTQADVMAVYGHSADQKNFLVKGAASKNFNLGGGVTAGPEIGITGNAEKLGNNHMGDIAPEINGVIRYNHKFENGVSVGAEAAGGGAMKYHFDDTKFKVKNNSLVGRVGVNADFNGVGAKVTAGRGAVEGNYVAAGVTARF